MSLQYLCSTPYVSIYFDAVNNWLFTEWEGDLTLDRVQLGCLEIAHCYLHNSYPRILNSNLRVTSVTPDIAGWLASVFMPTLELAGVKQLGWVIAPTLCGRNLVLDTLARCPYLGINAFEDVEAAVSWLQHNRPEATPVSGLAREPRLTTIENRMREQLNRLAQQLAETLRNQDTEAFALAQVA
jgi:hypothetical protein